MRINRLLLTALLLVSPATLRAQRPILDQADGAISNGTLTEARSLLERWRRENPRPEAEQQARYHLLSARTVMNADSAEDAYLTVAVNFPTSRAAPEALLRLAQARQMRGDTTQAVAYLERLLSDYPNSDQRPMAAVWLVRVVGGTRNTELCETLRGVQPGTNPETIALLRAEQQRVCGSVPPPSRAAAAPSPKPERADTTPRPQPPTANTEANATGRVAIQVGAFREVSGARDVKSQLARAGFPDARMVRVPGNNLIRVRVGRYANRAAAAAMLARLARADISAVLVTDADSETVVKN